MQKTVATIHDISCYGKCSLTVALPILSAAGIYTAVLPTAVLSTHTGGFSDNTFHDLTNDIEPISEHWKKEGIVFDAIYSGYLCSPTQINATINAIENIKNDNTLIIVDPVIGDNGTEYKGLSISFSGYMLRLCQKANIITPNITEACLLTGTPFIADGYDQEYIVALLKKLYEITKAKVVLTGVSFDKKKIGAAIFDGDEITYVFSQKSPKCYHSTGDIFASVLTASLLNGRSLKASAQIAVNFVSLCINQTVKDKTPERNGVNFESKIPELLRFLDL